MHTHCNKCHGWKELEYHPLNYKTRQCSNGNKCLKGKTCPYYHTASEKRKISENVKGGYFTYYPRNRRIGEDTESIKDLKSYFDQQKQQSMRSNNTFDSESSEGSVGDMLKQEENDSEIEEMVKRLIEE